MQNQTKQQVDQHRSEKCFDVGWVFLLLHLKQAICEKECWQYYMHLKNGDLIEWEDSSRMRMWKHCFVLFLFVEGNVPLGLLG